ncbi:Transposase for insertion sequence element IS1328 [Sinorhizobium fredii HH103]|uniref:Transposase for insertion sequence element IS1328 n=1 Tax=Sinorhizobium fredii (strain HH103) TaxID=1117943 RepID=G9A595_SINF1|nr:Transposase for insertion sequence element IS1328 [Sinorhizobium fredii HH103]
MRRLPRPIPRGCHGIDACGKVVVRKPLRRGDVMKFFAGLHPCLIGIEACATAHNWGRELSKLGHTVRLMPPAYVKAYVKRGKTEDGLFDLRVASSRRG